MNRISLFLENVLQENRKQGIRASLRYARDRLFRVSNSVLFQRSALRREDVLPSVLQIRAISPEKRGLYEKELDVLQVGSDVEYFDKKGECFLAYSGDEISGIGWRFSDSRLLRRLKYSDKAVYLGGFLVRPEYRGRGIYPALLRFMSVSRDGLFDRCFVETAGNNQASLRGLQKAGFVRMGSLHVRIFAGLMVSCNLVHDDLSAR